MFQRIIIILIIAGGALIFFGVRDYMLSSTTKQEPLEIELDNLEQDNSIDNNHILIGPHIALYSDSIFEYEYEEWEGENFTDSSTVNYTYYPVISYTHPFFDKVDELETEYGTIDDIPDELWPDIEHFAVLVKTTEFTTVGAIPDNWEYEDSVQGVVINTLESLDSEEKSLLKESFPFADMDNLLILDKGREPGSLSLSYVMIGGGVILILIGIGLIIKATSESKKPAATDTDPGSQ